MKMKRKLLPTLISATLLSALTGTAWAAGTPANTDIDNTATISYSVGTVSQTPIESSEAGNSTPGAGAGTATTFKVDKKIDMLVTTGSAVNVVPGATSQAITFTLENQGNSTENFDLAATQVAAGDQFDTTGCSITAPAALPVSLTADATQSVTVECDIPASSGTVTNGATSLIDLKATINGVTETAGADSAGTVDVVFADDTGTTTDGSDRNGQHSATNTYTVNTADITVQKTSAVTKMSINGSDVTTNPKRIPGATIEYSILVSNAASAATATGIVITDPVPANTTYVASSCAVTGDATPTCSLSGSDVTTATFDLAGGQSATLTFEVTVD